MTQPLPPSVPTARSPHTGRSGSTPLIVAIAVTAVLLVGVGVTTLVLVISSSDSGSTQGGPEDVVRDFIAAADAGDCELLVKHDVTELETVDACEDAYQEALDYAEDEGESGQTLETTIDRIEITAETSDTATVEVDATSTYQTDGDTETIENTREYALEKTADAWNIVDVEIVTED